MHETTQPTLEQPMWVHRYEQAITTWARVEETLVQFADTRDEALLAETARLVHLHIGAGTLYLYEIAPPTPCITSKDIVPSYDTLHAVHHGGLSKLADVLGIIMPKLEEPELPFTHPKTINMLQSRHNLLMLFMDAHRASILTDTNEFIKAAR